MYGLNLERISDKMLYAVEVVTSHGNYYSQVYHPSLKLVHSYHWSANSSLFETELMSYGSQTVMFHLLSESVIKEFGTYLAIYIFSTLKQMYYYLPNITDPMHIQ
jgi:hypothetical protein